MPDEHPLLLGMPGFWGLETTNAYARDADVVLAIGTRFAETDASSWNPAYTWRFPPTPADPDRHRPGRDRPQLPGRDRRRRRRRRSRCAAIADAVRAGAARAGVPAGAARADRGRPHRRCSPAAPNAAAATSSRCGRSGSSPTCARRCPPTRSWSPTSAGTRTASRSATRCRPRAASSPRAARPRWASARPPRSACSSPQPDRVVVALIGDGGMSAAAAGRADGRRARPAGDLRGHEQPRPRHHRRPAGRPTSAAATAASSPTRTASPYSPDFAALGRACGADGYAIERAGRPRAPRCATAVARAAARPCSTCRWSTSRCRRRALEHQGHLPGCSSS